jgi:hypothetical protein
MTFDEWLEETDKQRALLTAYGQSGRTDSMEGRAIDSELAIKMTDESARILNEAENFLALAREKAMWAARKDHPELNSRERELVERAAVISIKRVVDSCAVTHKSCVSRYFNYK